jgi:hypothetical protein
MPQPTPVPGEATPVPGELTPLPGESTPGAPSPTATPAAPERQVVLLPEDTTGGITWNLMIIGDFSVRLPNDLENGWVVSTLSPGEPNEMLFIGHRLGRVFDVAITIRVSGGEASVYAPIRGSFQRVEVEDVASAVPLVSEIVFHVLESISIAS